MPRDLPIGNGSLLVNFDRHYQLRDIYWPHVGLENHTDGHPFRFGVWADGRMSWVHAAEWHKELRYDDDTLVTRVRLVNPELGLEMLCEDAVDFHEMLYLRRMAVRNMADATREVRLFFCQDFHISGSDLGDTAYYEPERRAVFHYKRKRWFMIAAAAQRDGETVIGLDQWAVGVKEAIGLEGAWRDAEDGRLSGNAVAQGSVDSAVALHLTVPGRGEAIGWYWIAVGDHFKEVTRINRAVREKGPATFIERTRHYWRLWGTRTVDATSEHATPGCPLCRRSLLIIRTQIDNDGAIIAANDFDITRHYRDTYSYLWPRDGAITSAALISAGYSEPPQRFFNFCHSVIMEEGYLLHKYNPDGSLASSWHGWYHEGRKELPIQEDETALTLWALWRHFERFREIEFLKPLFRGLIVRAANWLAAFRDSRDRLPLVSWDLWEERSGIHAWTVGAVWGGLDAAERFASAFGEAALAEQYRCAKEEIRQAAETFLYAPELGRYVRTIHRRPDGGYERDETLDASLIGLWRFGMFPPDDPKIAATMRHIQDGLSVRTPVGGLARYERDAYHAVPGVTPAAAGNPWFVSTLWLAMWQVASAKTVEDLAPVYATIHWVASHALPSGVMAEQVHPLTHEPISVSPLTWSHAEYVNLLFACDEKRALIEGR